MDDTAAADGTTIVERAKSILLAPRDEWPRIEAEARAPGKILRDYVLPLAAIGPFASLIGSQVFGYGTLGFNWRPPLVGAIGTAIVSYVLALLSVLVLTLIADFLAPKFDGLANRAQAFRLVAYASTAVWLAGLFGLVPPLALFGLLGLYSIYLFHAGVSPMMKVPADKALGYTAVTIVSAAVLMVLASSLTTAVSGFWGAARLASGQGPGGRITLPDGRSVDVGQAERASRELEAAVNSASPPVEPAQLQALLPAIFGEYRRTAQETLAAGPMGSTAKATYTAGERSFDLSVVDMSALGALAGIGSAMGVSASREDEDGYERTGTVDGRMQSERWSRATGSGKFAVVIANRFLVSAEGQAASIDELKQAVATIDPTDLTDLVD